MQNTFPIQRLNTPYLNTISVEEQPAMPGDQDMERRIRALIRWNALAMVLRANKTGMTSVGILPASHRLPPYTMWF